ncbi:hypothetical protein N7467_011479 [Penicillium canescens]|nr:hypothetical protein N7467_011479 [Penicillium canescens]
MQHGESSKPSQEDASATREDATTNHETPTMEKISIEEDWLATAAAIERSDDTIKPYAKDTDTTLHTR